MPWLAASPERGCTKPAWPGRDRHRQPGCDHAAPRPARSTSRSTLDRSSPASPAYAVDGNPRIRMQPLDRERQRSRAVGAVGREPADQPLREPRRDQHALGRVLASGDRRARLVQRRQLGAAGRAAAAAGRRRSGRRRTRPRAASARPGPRRCAPTPAPRRGCGWPAAGASTSSTRSILFSTSSCGISSASISSSTVAHAARAAPASSSSLGRRVGDEQQQVAGQRLLERGRERLDQLVRQLADEPDRVGHQV